MRREPPSRLPFESGGLPDKARARLEEAAASGDRFFTTNLTVAETAIARLAGYQPLGQVMGSSFYHLGWSYGAWAGDGELEAITHAHREARTLALGRMREEAAILGATAVVGVKLQMKGFEWSGEMTEFTVVGTAVRAEGLPEGPPVLTTLSVQDLYKLELMGRWPVGVALGSCTWLNRHADCATDGSWINQEQPVRTWVADHAQALARDRFRADLAEIGAEEGVGVRIERHFLEEEYEMNNRSHTWFKAEVLLLGTGVVKRVATRVDRPRLVVDLGAGRKVDLGPRSEFKRKEDE